MKNLLQEKFNKILYKLNYKVNKLFQYLGKDLTTISFYNNYVYPYLMTNTFIDNLLNLTIKEEQVYERLWMKIKMI